MYYAVDTATLPGAQAIVVRYTEEQARRRDEIRGSG